MNPEISANDRLVDRIARNRALDPVATAIAVPMRKLLDSAGPLGPVADALHGTQLGHPLHPAVTDVPIGAWSLATLFDALEAAGSARFTPASDLAIGVGLAGGLVALASGWAEWSDTKGDPQRLGLVHATLNEIAFALYATSLVLRLRKQRGAGLATAFAGYAFVSISAYLGGELSFGMRLGTKHTNEPLAPPEDFTPVLLAAELNGAPVKVELDGIPLLISRNAKGDVSAIPAVCTHRGGPLEKGTFADGCVTCPWHHAQFSLETGCVERGPAVFSLAQFEARVRDGSVEVRPYRFA